MLFSSNRFLMPPWSSGGPLLIEVKHVPQPSSSGDFRMVYNSLRIADRDHGAGARIDEIVVDSLTVALLVVMGGVLLDRLP